MADLPTRTDGLPVLLRSDLARAHFTDDELAAMVRRGEIERISRGVFWRARCTESGSAADPSRYQRRVIARALTNRSCVISHQSAGSVRGMPVVVGDEVPVHLTRAGRGGNRVVPGLVQHSAILRADDIEMYHGLRITTPARTVLDVARTDSVRRAVAVADYALHSAAVSAQDIVGAVRRARRCRGMAAARRALSLADGRSESVGESYTRMLLSDLGIAGLELQVEVRSPRGVLLGRSDFGLLEAGVLIEFDGRIKYQRYRRAGESVTDMVLREKRREEILVEHGFVVLRLVWNDLRDPAAVLHRIRRAMLRGRRNVEAGLVVGRCTPRPALTVPGLVR